MPAGVTDPHLDPVDRFELWLRFLPSLLDDATSQSFVVGLLPIECSDDAGYARLIARVVPHPERPPWMEPLRLVAFDNRQSPQLSALLERQKVTHVLTASIDFSTPAITDALAREAVDPSVPQPQRLASLLQLAAIDFSYQRHDEAQRKYAMLFDAYSDPPDYVAQALCLQGTGDSQAATGELEKAKATLERGLALCVEHEQKVPMLQLLLSMIRLCFTLRHHEDAETYAHSGMILSAGAMNLPLCATLAEQKGDAQLAQEKRADAVASFLHARTLAEGIDLFPVWTSVLTKLIEHYAATGEHRRADELSDELRRVQAAERGLGPSPSIAGPAPANAESPA
jgi:tetratricopeptide (TPR) repeat protein